MGQKRNADLLEEMEELPVEEQLRRKRLQWFGHIQRMADHRPQKQIFRSGPAGKKRRPGGTSWRWVDLISKDLQGIPEWQVMVKKLEGMEKNYQFESNNT